MFPFPTPSPAPTPFASNNEVIQVVREMGQRYDNTLQLGALGLAFLLVILLVLIVAVILVVVIKRPQKTPTDNLVTTVTSLFDKKAQEVKELQEKFEAKFDALVAEHKTEMKASNEKHESETRQMTEQVIASNNRSSKAMESVANSSINVNSELVAVRQTLTKIDTVGSTLMQQVLAIVKDMQTKVTSIWSAGGGDLSTKKAAVEKLMSTNEELSELEKKALDTGEMRAVKDEPPAPEKVGLN